MNSKTLSTRQILDGIEEARRWEGIDSVYDKALAHANGRAVLGDDAGYRRTLETFYDSYVSHELNEKYRLLNTGHMLIDESHGYMDPKEPKRAAGGNTRFTCVQAAVLIAVGLLALFAMTGFDVLVKVIGGRP